MDESPSSTGRPKRNVSIRDYSLLFKRPAKVQKTKANARDPTGEPFTEGVAYSEIAIKNEPVFESHEADGDLGMEIDAPALFDAIVKDELILEDVVLEPLEEVEEVKESQVQDCPAVLEKLLVADVKPRIKKKVSRKKVFTKRLKVKKKIQLKITKTTEGRSPKPIKMVKKVKEPKLASTRAAVFVCGVCNQTFSKNSAFVQHALHRHRPNFDPIEKRVARKHLCELCGMKFINRQSLARHEQFHAKRQHASLTVAELPEEVTQDEDGLIECSECSQKLSSREDYVAHYRRHMYLKQLDMSCKICGELFEYKSNLKIHVRTHKVEQVEKVIKDENGMFRCSECMSTYVNRLLCMQHIRTHASNFRCATCGKFWESEEKLRKHEKLHAKTPADSIAIETDENGLFKCSECPRVYTHRSLCILHMRGIHGINTKRQTELVTPLPDDATICPECSKIFTNPSAFDQHWRRHQLVRQGRFQCKECGRNMTSKVALERHTFIHEYQRKNNDGTNPDNFGCAECDKEFLTWKTFARHVTWHTKENKNCLFTCRICENIFTSQPSLVKHRLIVHPGEGFDESTIVTKLAPLWEYGSVAGGADAVELKCPECGKTFTSRNSLCIHITKHNNVRIGRYTCKHCGRKHGTLAELTKHEQRHEKSLTYQK